MALIACPECTREVSSTAVACPGCGAPIAERGQIGVALQTVQETSKKLKTHILIASALFWAGVIWIFAGVNASHGGFAAGGVALTLLGFVYYLGTRFRIWWHHK